MAKAAGGKNRKYNRNKRWCEQYANDHRREKNKARRMKRHLKRHPEDLVAMKVLSENRFAKEV